MSIKYIQKLAKVLEEYNLTRIEVSCFFGLGKVSVENQEMGISSNPHNIERVVETIGKELISQDSKYISIKSPMVGTFYSSPAPDVDPSVAV